MTTDANKTTIPLPIPIRKHLQRMLELKVGMRAMEAEYKRLAEAVLQSKYAPQVYGDPLLGSLSQSRNVTYNVAVKPVLALVGINRFLEMVKISKTELEKGVTKVELTKLEEQKVVTSTAGDVSYTFKAPAKAKK